MNFPKISLKKLWRDMDIWLFFGFLITLPLSVRKVLWYLPLGGVFNEYADASLYLSDILLGMTLAVWIYRLRNRLSLLSIVRHCSMWNNSRKSLLEILILTLPLVLIAVALFSIHASYKPFFGIIFLLKLIELYGLYLFCIFRIVPCGTSLNVSLRSYFKTGLKIFLLIGVFESLLGILQVVRQHSLGLPFVKESIIDPSLPGVAKIIIDGHSYIRAYGTFPHPNILGGFLLISLIISHLYFRMFHVEQKQWFLNSGFSLSVQYVGLLTTVSKSAIAGFLIAWIYIGFVSRGTVIDSVKSSVKNFCIKSKLFHVERWIVVLIIILGMSVLLPILWKIDSDKLFLQSLREREVYQNIALDIVHNHPILGISCGQLVIFMSQQPTYPLLPWQLQPVHNVFLLVWAELGVVGFFIFTLWYVLLIGTIPSYKSNKRGYLTTALTQDTDGHLDSSMFHVKQLEISSLHYRAIIIGFLPMLLFDHYLWDIQQGQLLLWLVSGVGSGLILQHKYK